MQKFAKLFDTASLGQILVLQDTNDEGNPSVKIMFQPEGLGVCAFALNFTDDDAGWESCDKAFDTFDAEYAESVVSEQIKALGLEAIAVGGAA